MKAASRQKNRPVDFVKRGREKQEPWGGEECQSPSHCLLEQNRRHHQWWPSSFSPGDYFPRLKEAGKFVV